MRSRKSISRRTFIRDTATTLGGFIILPRHVLGKGYVPPSDKLTKAIIGVGGILSGYDAVSKIEAGADVVQIYTGLIYKGPALVHEVAKALKQISHN